MTAAPAAADAAVEDPARSWMASDEDRSVIRLPGTHRARSPQASLATATRAAARVGVTRVADITRLDTIGIPTYQAVRPLSRTLAVSQGKGVTAELARLSAVMESIETWHVEQPMEPVLRAAPRDVGRAFGRDLGYDAAAIPQCAPSVLHDGLPLDWVAARSLADGRPTLVPLASVYLSLEEKQGWNPPAFLASTNGLAGGNTLVEATLHALYEVIERDATTVALADGRGKGVPCDPRTLGSAVVDGLCELIDRAGVTLRTWFVASATGLPCFTASVLCHDYPAAMFGFGCHLSPEIALSRAITEAVQARLAYIAGARDDLEDDSATVVLPGRPAAAEPLADVRELTGPVAGHDSLLADLDDVVARASAAFGHPPLVVDLTREEIGVAVAKVVAPGSRVTPEVL